MNADIFAEWLSFTGYKVYRTVSSYWACRGLPVYQAFPYHWIIEPIGEEINEFVSTHHVLGLRYSTLVDSEEGALSYHVVLQKNKYELATLSKKSRHDVQKGLSLYRFEPISFQRVAEEGWELRMETLSRQRRFGAENKNWWQRICDGASKLPGFEMWGAISNNNELAACLFAFHCDGCVNILYHQSRTIHLSNGVNNALAFTFTEKCLREDLEIFYGLNSLDAPVSVDQFKFRMGYSPKPVRQRVVFNPLFSPLVNSVSGAVLRIAHNLLPSNELIAKAEGLVRFNLQGRLPLNSQPPIPAPTDL